MGKHSEKEEVLNLEKPLFHFIAELEKRGISYAMVGGLAVNAWGFRRFTHDVDFTIILTEEQSQEFVSYLKNNPEYKIQSVSFVSLEKIPDFIRLRMGEIPVDFLVANTEFMEGVIHRAVRIKFFDKEVPFATPEDLLVFKLLADRPHDHTDVQELLKSYPNMEWAYIEKWCRAWEIEERLKPLRFPNS